MFKIWIEGETVDIEPGAEIITEAENPFFSIPLESEGTYTIAASLTDKNLRLLGFPQAKKTSEKIELKGLAQVGSNFYEAIIEVTEMNETIGLVVTYGAVAFSSFSKSIREFDYTPEETVQPFTFQEQWERGTKNRYPDTEYYFPMIIAEEFYDNIDVEPSDRFNVHFQRIINQGFDDAGTYKPVQNVELGGIMPANYNTVCPQWPLIYILKKGFEDAGFRFIGDWSRLAAAREIYLFNNRPIDQPENPLPHWNARAWRIQPVSVSTNSGVVPIDTTNTPSVFNLSANTYTPVQPGVYRFRASARGVSGDGIAAGVVSLSLYRVQNNVETRIAAAMIEAINFTATLEITVNIPASGLSATYILLLQDRFEIFNPAIIDNIEFEVNRVQEELPKLIFPRFNKFAPYMPDINFGDLVNATLDSFLLGPLIDFQNKTISFEPRNKSGEIGKLISLDGHCEDAPSFSVVPDVPFALSWKSPGQWEEEEVPSEIYRRYMIFEKGEMRAVRTSPENIISREIHQSPLVSDNIQWGNNNFYNGSAVRGQGDNEAFNLSNELKDIRFAFFRGIMGAYATSLPWNSQYTFVLSAQSTSIAVLYQRWYQRQFENRREWNITIIPTHPEALSLQATDRLVYDNTLFIIKKISKEFSTSALQAVKLVGMRG
ncbi:MAG: hypothetical protein LAT81_14950 [Oceanicaulis sp.]|nr:hypothetical protein [Oceanicaulis sp.]